jgi:hypothetical protein
MDASNEITMRRNENELIQKSMDAYRIEMDNLLLQHILKNA